jgi:hypothetical protein
MPPSLVNPGQRHLESGLYFDPPHARCFRWDTCPDFKTFKRFGLAEMDFGWRDEATATLHLLELKDYSTDPYSDDWLIGELVQKATDCLLLLASVWYELPRGDAIRSCLPDEWHEHADGQPIQLNFVLKTADVVPLHSLQDKLRNKLLGRQELLALRTVTTVYLVNHELAVSELGLPLTPADEPRAGRRTTGERPRKRRERRRR